MMLGTACLYSYNVIVNANRKFLVIKMLISLWLRTSFSLPMKFMLIFKKLKILCFNERQSYKLSIKTEFIKDAEEGVCYSFLRVCTKLLQPDFCLDRKDAFHFPDINYGTLWLYSWACDLSQRLSFQKVKLISCINSLPYHIPTHLNLNLSMDQVQYCLGPSYLFSSYMEHSFLSHMSGCF